MKRDMDIIRHILQDLEGRPPGHAISSLENPGVETNEYIWHIELLLDADMIKGRVNCYATGSFQVDRITWHGIEFLQASRDDTLWNKAKEHVLNESASWSFSLLMEYLKSEARQRLGIPIP